MLTIVNPGKLRTQQVCASDNGIVRRKRYCQQDQQLMPLSALIGKFEFIDERRVGCTSREWCHIASRRLAVSGTISPGVAHIDRIDYAVIVTVSPGREVP
jgi:hypothetical protein